MTRKHRPQDLILFSLVVIVLAIGATTLGYLVGTGTKDHDSPESETLDFQIENSNVEEQKNQAGTTYTLVDFLDNTQFNSHLERSSALYDLFASIDMEMLQDYWEQTQNFEASPIRDQIQDVIIQRWSVLDPIGALAVIEQEALDARQQVLFEFVFHEWSLIDLENAVDYVSNLENDAQLQAIASIVRTREDMTNKQRREIARQFDCEWVAIDVLRETTDSVVIDKPAQEWRSFVWENRDELQNLSDAQNRLLEQLAYFWIVQEGVTAFEKMRHSLPSDFSLLETTRSVSSELVESNPQLAFDLVLAGKQREKETGYFQLAMDLITRWARTDARRAFDATSEVSGRSFQVRLRTRALWAWAQHNPESLLNNIEELPKSVQLKARETAFTYIARQSPQRVRAMLSSIADRNYRNVIAETVVDGWALTDLPGTLDWIDSDDSLADIRKDLKRSAYFSLAQENPRLAVETAVTQPLTETNRGWEALVIIWTANDNLDVAASLLPLARPGKTTVDAYTAVVEDLIDDEDWERSIELIVQYDEQAEGTIFDLVKPIAQAVPLKLYETLDGPGSVMFKRSVAWQLFHLNKDNGKFTDAQLERLEEISQTPIPERPQRERSERLQKAFDNFHEALREEESD